MERTVRVWFDAEAEYPEVRFGDGPAFTVETDDEAVMKRVDAAGNMLGFTIFGVSRRARERRPLAATLVTTPAA